MKKALLLVKQRARQGEKVTLDDLSREVGMSKWHLQRLFKKKFGASPKELGESLERKDRPFEERSISGRLPVVLYEETLAGNMLSPALTDDLDYATTSEMSSISTPILLTAESVLDNMDDSNWLSGFGEKQLGHTVAAQTDVYDYNMTGMASFDPEVVTNYG